MGDRDLPGYPWPLPDFSVPRPRINGEKLKLPGLVGRYASFTCEVVSLHERFGIMKSTDGFDITVNYPEGTSMTGPFLELIVIVRSSTLVDLAFRPTEMGASLDMSLINELTTLMWTFPAIFGGTEEM